jgi:hypothetical protein
MQKKIDLNNWVLDDFLPNIFIVLITYHQMVSFSEAKLGLNSLSQRY